MAVSSLPPIAAEDTRARDLATMKRRATALLAVMAGVYVALAAGGGDATWADYARAAAEGSLVGGLADWCAVTALFRHPLGLPIPHTAVIRARKDQFGETLGAFVQENFLVPSAVLERVRAADVPSKMAVWLIQRPNAERVARQASEAVVGLADAVRDEDVHRIIEEELARGIDAMPVAPLAGKALRMVNGEGRHQELFDVILRGVERFLLDNKTTLRDKFGEESPWWLPDAAEDRIFERLLGGVTRLLHAVNDDPDHEVRKTFDARLLQMIDRLETSPDMLERGEELKRELLEPPDVRGWSSSLWRDIKATLRTQATAPDSELRRRLADAAVVIGHRLNDDPALRAKVEQVLESAVTYLIEHFEDEVSGLVSSTVALWDAEETSDKLELLLGRDLQFIRINGTVVGALAGLAIHGSGQLLG